MVEPPAHPDDQPGPGSRYDHNGYDRGGHILPPGVVVGGDREAIRIAEQLRENWRIGHMAIAPVEVEVCTAESAEPVQMLRRYQRRDPDTGTPIDDPIDIASSTAMDHQVGDMIVRHPQHAVALSDLAQQVTAADGQPPVLLHPPGDDDTGAWALTRDGVPYHLDGDGIARRDRRASVVPGPALRAHADVDDRARARDALQRREDEIAAELQAAMQRSREREQRRRAEAEQARQPDPKRAAALAIQQARAVERREQANLSRVIALPARYTAARAFWARAALAILVCGILSTLLLHISVSVPAAGLLLAALALCGHHQHALDELRPRIDDQFSATLAAENALTEAELDYAAAGGDPDGDELPDPPRKTRLPRL